MHRLRRGGPGLETRGTGALTAPMPAAAPAPAPRTDIPKMGENGSAEGIARLAGCSQPDGHTAGGRRSAAR